MYDIVEDLGSLMTAKQHVRHGEKGGEKYILLETELQG
jgi:hypothetical protein